MVNYGTCFKIHLRLIERALKKELQSRAERPRTIHQAIQYAVFTGGKRFRPVLVLAACEACGGRMKDALRPACAVELIHTYSLVHDDLPALDNDAVRRGRPTCHKKFGEATAILAGDGLLTLAFEILSGVQPAEKAIRLVREISTAAGVHGMIAGQVEDIETISKRLDLATHDFICVNKTGKLIRSSVKAGALVAGASPKKLALIDRYAHAIGLAFQVVDDLLDQDGYCRFMPEDQVVQKARQLIKTAKTVAGKLGTRARYLVLLADFLESRIPRK
jgi:geranylgeranyl diphosphate synthase, type II